MPSSCPPPGKLSDQRPSLPAHPGWDLRRLTTGLDCCLCGLACWPLGTCFLVCCPNCLVLDWSF